MIPMFNISFGYEKKWLIRGVASRRNLLPPLPLTTFLARSRPSVGVALKARERRQFRPFTKHSLIFLIHWKIHQKIPHLSIKDSNKFAPNKIQKRELTTTKMGANHQHSSAKCHSEFLLSSRQIRPSNLFVFCLIFLLICLNFVALATPNKMDNKVEKTSAEQQQVGVEQHEKHQKTMTTTTVAADVEQEEIQTCTVRVQVVKKVVGKCVRLRGGNSACQTDDFLDPVNEDCIFE